MNPVGDVSSVESKSVDSNSKGTVVVGSCEEKGGGQRRVKSRKVENERTVSSVSLSQAQVVVLDDSNGIGAARKRGKRRVEEGQLLRSIKVAPRRNDTHMKLADSIRRSSMAKSTSAEVNSVLTKVECKKRFSRRSKRREESTPR